MKRKSIYISIIIGAGILLGIGVLSILPPIHGDIYFASPLNEQETENFFAKYKFRPVGFRNQIYTSTGNFGVETGNAISDDFKKMEKAYQGVITSRYEAVDLWNKTNPTAAAQSLRDTEQLEKALQNHEITVTRARVTGKILEILKSKSDPTVDSVRVLSVNVLAPILRLFGVDINRNL